jgi:hypothetical protein
MKGREPVTVEADRAIVMPPQVKMAGYSNEPLRPVILSVSDPDTPFLGQYISQ